MSKTYDPPMHTAEHILNQTMIQKFDCGRDFRAHIEKRKSKCDYHFNSNITQEDITEVEEKVNEIIDADLTVNESLITKDEAEKLYNTEKLPNDAGEKIRIVKIGDYDKCPCIGPHVQSTGEIGRFKIISNDFNEGVLRIRFKLI
ncbi:MAG TPA: hypothetical protein QF753_15600 [Victivallales bacterium]|nr:hypothetical protein [Victivallales bacterium]